ncbi:MAG: AMP-binding protein [Akkermansia sp.]
MSAGEHLWVNGELVGADSLASRRRGCSGIEAELADFLARWFDDSPTMELHTSGSTGAPKCIRAPKEAMRRSAELTLAAFGLQRGARVLLALPLRYIAGQMMVVRALVGGLQLLLREPSSLLPEEEDVAFAPLVPMQFYRTLQEPDGLERLNRVHTLLLGGGFAELPERAAGLRSRLFASYGMTETLSHIALRRLNGPEADAWYRPLPGVRVGLDAQGCLTVAAAHLGGGELVTHDVAELAPDGRFRILGRRDAVINSGGVKIQAEEVEQALTAATGLACVAVPAPHPLLGQCVALLWEGSPADEARLRAAAAQLPRYHQPKILHRTDALPRTATGKPARAEAARLLPSAAAN